MSNENMKYLQPQSSSYPCISVKFDEVLGHSQFVHVRCATIVVEILLLSVGTLVRVLCTLCFLWWANSYRLLISVPMQPGNGMAGCVR
jgi:hypothetical protein